MCGIAGLVCPNLAAAEISEKTMAMQTFLTHRGPDEVGLYAADGIGLAHTRLSIIDLIGGHQPLTNERKTIQLVVNGEIYNYIELRDKLTAQGHRFRTESDCETIVHLYEQYGKDCINYLNGMFAFALWDARQHKLMLARDRFGIKPLYIGRLKNLICFASELTAITGSGLIEKQIDPQALYAYLAFSYVPGPMSILKNVQKVQPSERILISCGKVERDIYWKPARLATPRSKTEAMHELTRRLEKSVSSHLVSDVSVAAFLSGGVDSSTVVAMARRNVDIETFCISFPGTGVDEAPIARKVARHLGVRHHEIPIEIDPEQLLEEAVDHMDEPFADASALPTYAVCRAARPVAKVVLSGDGADEVFGGYTGRYRAASLAAVMPHPRRLAWLLRQIPPWRNGSRSSTPKMLDWAAMPETERYVRERQITSARQRIALFGEDLARTHEPMLRQIAARVLTENAYTHPVQRALWLDIRTSLPDDMLTKVDRMSMANGIEVRVPFLDHAVVEFALSLPVSWSVSPWPVEGKRLLRELAEPLLPTDVLVRPKQGFVVPLNRWLRNGLLDRFDAECMASNSRAATWIEKRALADLRQESISEKPRQDLYALMVLEQWLRCLGR
jgi:asparagine synthase (glutamine-hydrolysing)